MGNRANIIFANESFEKFSPVVYLHWNGGPESVYQFLDELDRRRVGNDQNYECARFIQIVGEFFDQNRRTVLSLGVVNGPTSIHDIKSVATDSGDNGFYVVSRGKTRVVRRFRGHPLTELTPERVEEERAAAYKHKYMEDDGGFQKIWERKKQ